MNYPDGFRNRISFNTETMPAAEVEFWAKKVGVDPQVVIDAYAEIRRGIQNPPAPALADGVPLEARKRRMNR